MNKMSCKLESLTERKIDIKRYLLKTTITCIKKAIFISSVNAVLKRLLSYFLTGERAFRNRCRDGLYEQGRLAMMSSTFLTSNRAVYGLQDYNINKI